MNTPLFVFLDSILAGQITVGIVLLLVLGVFLVLWLNTRDRSRKKKQRIKNRDQSIENALFRLEAIDLDIKKLSEHSNPENVAWLAGSLVVFAVLTRAHPEDLTKLLIQVGIADPVTYPEHFHPDIYQLVRKIKTNVFRELKESDVRSYMKRDDSAFYPDEMPVSYKEINIFFLEFKKSTKK